MRDSKIMTVGLIGCVVLIGVMILSLFTAPQPTRIVPPAPMRVAPAIVEAPAPKPVEQVDDSIRLSGMGNPKSLGGERTEAVYLAGGTYNIRVTHDGKGFFTMALMGSSYRPIVDQLGAVDTTVKFNLAEGDYRFGFQADGMWTVTVTEVK